MHATRVHFEQAVYGSFPFWDRGYAVLAQSQGCKAEWLTAFQDVCQKFGERPRGVEEFGRSLFAMRLNANDGPWMIVGVSTTGKDDHGRPGALAFHGLFIEKREYRKARFNPFALAGALRSDWTSETTFLEAGSWPIDETICPVSDEATRIAERIRREQRVAIEASAPIEELARSVWQELPENVRKTASLATWAFANGNRFDLIGVPDIKAIEWDESYADLPAKASRQNPLLAFCSFFVERASRLLFLQKQAGRLPFLPKQARRPLHKSAIYIVGVVLAIMLTGVIVLAFCRGRDVKKDTEASTPVSALQSTSLPPLSHAPDSTLYRDEVDPDEKVAVARNLVTMAERFGVAIEGDPSDPTATMLLLNDRLRYRGPLFSEVERSKLASVPSPGHSRALAWDEHIRRFVADRPLPPHFSQGSLRWQLDTLAWSFHLEPDSRIPIADVPKVLIDSLSLDEAIGPNPLEAKYPALVEYARFLSKLPRR